MMITQNGEVTMVAFDVESAEECECTLAFLKILAIGSFETEKGQFSDAQDMFARLNKADTE